MRRPFALVVLLLAPNAHAQTEPAHSITVYRCVDKTGAVALRDSPCPPGETQQVREMVRPQDAPPPAVVPAPVAAPAPTIRERIIVRTPTQPMYECTDAETGGTYVSDDDNGNPRWVNDYGFGYGIRRHPIGPPPPSQPQMGISANLGSAHSGASVNVPLGPAPHPQPGIGAVVVTGGHMIHDTCRILPQADACARLNDRRYDILKNYGVVSQEKEHELEREQRGIDARIANDCGNY